MIYRGLKVYKCEILSMRKGMVAKVLPGVRKYLEHGIVLVKKHSVTLMLLGIKNI
jgi:hypothetical protein